MGSWNGTCSFTNLPIEENEDVYYFYVKNGIKSRGTSKGDHYEESKPITIAILAKYDGNGSIKDSDFSTVARLNLSIISDIINTEKLDFETDGDLSLRLDAFSVYVARSSENETDISNYSLLMVKKDIYENMIHHAKMNGMLIDECNFTLQKLMGCDYLELFPRYGLLNEKVQVYFEDLEFYL